MYDAWRLIMDPEDDTVCLEDLRVLLLAVLGFCLDTTFRF